LQYLQSSALVRAIRIGFGELGEQLSKAAQ
jgi:hypothetical protein